MSRKPYERKHCFPMSELFKSTLFIQGKLDTEISKHFHDIKTNADRIRLNYKGMQDWHILPPKDEMQRQKNSDKANIAREEGNQEFRKEQYVNALESYNESLCLAPPGSEVMAFAYANRSAAYLKAGFYKFCLENIEMALQNGYPDNLKPKLLDRKQECLKVMKGKKDSMNVHHKEAEVKLSYPAAPNMPHVISSLKYDGNRVITTRKLSPGDIIMWEKPFTQMLFDTSVYMHCYTCLSSNFLNLRPCPVSTTVMFCSGKCSEEAWKRCYKYEHSVIDGLHVWFEKVPLQAFHTTLQAFTMVDNPTDLKHIIDSIKDDDHGFNIDYTQADEKMLFRAFYALKPHQDNLSELLLFDHTTICAMMWHIAKEYTDMKNLLKNKEIEDMFLELLMRFLQISDIYMHSFTTAKKQHPNSNEFSYEYTAFASGISSTYSLFSHSCAPNTFCFPHGKALHFIVCRPIKAGQEVNIDYGQNHMNVPLRDRQLFLAQKFATYCECEACRKNFDTFDKLPVKHVIPDDIFDPMSAVMHDNNFDENSVRMARKVLKDLSKTLTKVDQHYPCQDILFMQHTMKKCIEIMYGQRPLELLFNL